MGMRFVAVGLVVHALCLTAHADVAGELARMLAKHPRADANRDGKLSEGEAGNYILRTVQRKRPNRGPGIRNRSLIDAYEAAFGEIQPASDPAGGENVN